MRPIILQSLVLLFASGQAWAEEPPPGSVGIQDITYFGQGCPDNSVAVNISSDRKALTAVYTDFVVDSANGPRSKTCELRIALQIPRGWTYTLSGVIQRGYADLDAGAHGVMTTSFQINNTSAPVSLGKLDIRGPYNDNYVRQESVPPSRLPHGKCDGSPELVTVHSNLTILKRPSGGVMALDSTNGEVAQIHEISWKRCPDKLPPETVIEVKKFANPRAGAAEYRDRTCPRHPRRVECSSGQTYGIFVGRPNDGQDTYECRCR